MKEVVQVIEGGRDHGVILSDQVGLVVVHIPHHVPELARALAHIHLIRDTVEAKVGVVACPIVREGEATAGMISETVDQGLREVICSTFCYVSLSFLVSENILIYADIPEYYLNVNYSKMSQTYHTVSFTIYSIIIRKEWPAK